MNKRFPARLLLVPALLLSVPALALVALIRARAG